MNGVEPLWFSKLITLFIRSGSGAKKSARNFVFAALSPEKPDLDPQVEPQHTIEKQAPPAAKRTKLDRTLKANNRPTIFNLL